MVYWARIPYGDRKVALDGFSWVLPWIKRVASQDIQFAWPIGIGLVGSAANSAAGIAGGFRPMSEEVLR